MLRAASMFAANAKDLSAASSDGIGIMGEIARLLAVWERMRALYDGAGESVGPRTAGSSPPLSFAAFVAKAEQDYVAAAADRRELRKRWLRYTGVLVGVAALAVLVFAVVSNARAIGSGPHLGYSCTTVAPADRVLCPSFEAVTYLAAGGVELESPERVSWLATFITEGYSPEAAATLVEMGTGVVPTVIALLASRTAASAECSALMPAIVCQGMMPPCDSSCLPVKPCRAACLEAVRACTAHATVAESQAEVATELASLGPGHPLYDSLADILTGSDRNLAALIAAVRHVATCSAEVADPSADCVAMEFGLDGFVSSDPAFVDPTGPHCAPKL